MNVDDIYGTLYSPLVSFDHCIKYKIIRISIKYKIISISIKYKILRISIKYKIIRTAQSIPTAFARR